MVRIYPLLGKGCVFYGPPRDYISDREKNQVSREAHMEVDSNTSTVALRVVGGDERESSALGCNRATLFLVVINTGTWPSWLEESRI
jgi:hypothetical protein